MTDHPTAPVQDDDGFVPCPLCKQYSHSLGKDKLAEAFNHFQSMFSHRGDGIPTQFCFDEQTRDAAQVLIAASRLSPTPETGLVEALEEAREGIAIYGFSKVRGRRVRQSWASELLAKIDSALSNVLPDEVGGGDR